jgi:MFS transporter, Spinster family, sphingosine-1-phosphate transporter
VAAWLPVYVFEREAKFVVNDDAITKLKGGDGFVRSDGVPAVPPAVTAKLLPSSDVQTVHQLRERLKQEMGDDDFRQYSSWVIDAATADGSLTSGWVSLIFGVLLVVAGLTATPLGAWLAGRLNGKVRGPFLLVSGVGALAAFPFVVGMLFLPFPWAWGCVFAAVFGLFLYTGPAFTLLANVTTPAVRATAFAINILVIHALGDAISPAILGAVADASDLHTAILGSSVLILVGGGLWLWGMRYEAADTAKAQ